MADELVFRLTHPVIGDDLVGLCKLAAEQIVRLRAIIGHHESDRYPQVPDCVTCGQPWPCPTSIKLEEARRG